MKSQNQHIRNEKIYRYSSSKKYLKIFVPDFAFKHDNDDANGKDKFVGRDVQFRRLYTWLTSESKSGSYLITGYRGMGKSLLVRRVIEVISREPKAYKEVVFLIAIVAFFIATYLCFTQVNCCRFVSIPLYLISVLLVTGLCFSNRYNYYLFEKERIKLKKHHLYDKEMVSKFFVKRKDRREREYNIMQIKINLGQEVLHERDVLSLMAQNIYDKYNKFVKNDQSRPLYSFIKIGIICLISFLLCKFFGIRMCDEIVSKLYDSLNHCHRSYIGDISWGVLEWIERIIKQEYLEVARVLLYGFSFWLTYKLFKAIRKHTPYFSIPYNSIERLSLLCERIRSTVNENTGSIPRYSSNFLTLSLFNKSKNKTTPMANVREIEQELLSIINGINGNDCPKSYRAQFIIVFDELDKITKASNRELSKKEGINYEGTPDFDTTVNGFTDAMAYEERKQNVLRLLANMKLFISTVQAKCVFISGHELFDASMADLSDREFAINSIFNGVLNVNSFLTPERGETDVSSMTELYVATMLMPEDYLIEKMNKNSSRNNLLKEEQPSLRWYYEYLMDKHVLQVFDDNDDEQLLREQEIKYAIEFLRYFTVFLSHISNGSPKKIATYFEKYIKTNYDAINQFDWHDEIVVGVPSEKDVRKQCVLYFDPNSQKLINFIYYIASPVMNAITNEVSNYGDKLMVSSSFILDHIYKYHGKGFSWRNLELMPELLTSNKNPELRDSMASIVEFLLQIHITNISSGIFQYKFHKQISEEISTLSKISEEASAIFNFTLNESESVKRYNTRLLNHYMNLAASKPTAFNYKDVLERIHENQGDIFFSEEDYYRAIHEYRSALQYIPKNNTVNSVLSHLKCSLKIGMSYEYRRTYENAYTMYCEIINRLIHLHWIEEGNLGLDYTMRLTGDWRVKQNVLVDKDTFKYKYDYNDDLSFRRQFDAGLWEDIKGTIGVANPKYSLDADKSISGLSALYTPEKSDIFERLTTFEEVKYVYQAIIAKLFVAEKMEVSGITQASIEEAEAEFMTLYSDTNIDEKFIIAADFFNKMSEILYYKNNYVIANRWGDLASSLYKFDFDVFCLLDNYCFKECKDKKEANAIDIKDDVRLFFSIVGFNDIDPQSVFTLKNDNVFVKIFGSKEFKNRIQRDTDVDYQEAFKNNVNGYLNYLKSNKVYNNQSKWSKIYDCADRINQAKTIGCRFPCNACKYANRSLLILMENMFDKKLEDDFETAGKAVILLQFTSHQFVKHLRQSQVSLLASTAEQLANILLSCSSTDVRYIKHIEKCDSEVSVEVIDLLTQLSRDNIDEKEREIILSDFRTLINTKDERRDSTHLFKLDKVLLYYWAAYRYYEIASMYKEALQCVERVIKVLEDYLFVIGFDKSVSSHRIDVVRKIKTGKYQYELINNLFKHAAIIVGRQYDSFDMAEIHEYKWLFHMERADDIDLTKLSVFPNLQPMFNSAINCKILCMQYLKLANHGDSSIKDEYYAYLAKIYKRVSPALRHEKTFKCEVETYYLKAHINQLVLIELLGKDVLSIEREAYLDNKSNKKEVEHHMVFYTILLDYFKRYNANGLDNQIFGIDNNIESKINLLNFLVHDSMICLTNILKILTPHNHITTFSNSFMAEVYDLLWNWSKYYELLYDLYIYYRYYEENDIDKMNSIIAMSSRNTGSDEDILNKKFRDCVVLMKNEGVLCKDEFGYLYSKLLLSIRHEMDDASIHHMYTNYSADKAIKYYRAAREVNNEGPAYKNMIDNMYVLNDDLHNDTCQSNLADERYLLNSGVIYTKRRQLEKMYERTNINKMSSYEQSLGGSCAETFIKMLNDRFEDSLFINTEY